MFIGVRMIFHSDRDVTIMATTIGLTSIAWLAYLFFRILGIRYGVRPKLTHVLKRVEANSPPDSDYQI